LNQEGDEEDEGFQWDEIIPAFIRSMIVRSAVLAFICLFFFVVLDALHGELLFPGLWLRGSDDRSGAWGHRSGSGAAPVSATDTTQNVHVDHGEERGNDSAPHIGEQGEQGGGRQGETKSESSMDQPGREKDLGQQILAFVTETPSIQPILEHIGEPACSLPPLLSTQDARLAEDWLQIVPQLGDPTSSAVPVRARHALRSPERRFSPSRTALNATRALYPPVLARQASPLELSFAGNR
jgi:hypothetical protein